MRTFVIADIGACHDGKSKDMFAAVQAAKDAGVDAIKFQWVSDPWRMAKRRGRAEADGYGEIYRKYLAWDLELMPRLAEHCKTYGIGFMCTAFLPEDVAVVAPYVQHFKIASFEAEDEAMYKAHVGLPNDGRKVIVSLGMGAKYPYYDVAPYEAPCDLPRRELARLHCVSAYPAPVDSLGLYRLHPQWDNDGDLLEPIDGFSDHSDPALTWTGALAVAAGAEIVEAHLRLDWTDTRNPDYGHAMTVREFDAYVRHIRFAESCLAIPAGPVKAEEQMKQYKVNGGR